MSRGTLGCLRNEYAVLAVYRIRDRRKIRQQQYYNCSYAEHKLNIMSETSLYTVVFLIDR